MAWFLVVRAGVEQRLQVGDAGGGVTGWMVRSDRIVRPRSSIKRG